jgi:hypothetical protein
MGPPSSPDSRLEAELKLTVDGDGRDEGTGVGSLLAVPLRSFFLMLSPIKFRAAFIRLRLFPLPNLPHG